MSRERGPFYRSFVSLSAAPAALSLHAPAHLACTRKASGRIALYGPISAGYYDAGKDVVVVASTEAQKRASAKYQREKTRQVNLKFSPREMDLYRWLEGQGGTMSGTLKQLIRDEIGRRGDVA